MILIPRMPIAYKLIQNQITALLGENFDFQQMFQEPLGLTLSALPSKDASQVNVKILFHSKIVYNE